MTQPAATNPTDAPLGADVLRHHGLRAQPFAARAAEGFVYGDPALDMPVGVLLQRLQNENKPLLLVGEHGVGKSTQLLQLLSRGGATLVFCGFKGRRGATFASIEHAIRQQWGRTNIESAMHQQNGETSATSEHHSLAMILLTVCRGERRPVLVIDDAHLLGSTVLGTLLRLRREVNRHCGGHTLGVVLAGDPTLEESVSEAQGGHAPAEPLMTIRLRPLLPPQTDAYLRHRLQAAGAANPDVLSGEIARVIHQESSGLPLEINLAANRHLQRLARDPENESLDHASAPHRRVRPAMTGTGPRWLPLALAGLGGLLVGTVLASLFFLSDGPRLQVEQPPQEPMPASAATREPIAVSTPQQPLADLADPAPGPIASLPTLPRTLPQDDPMAAPAPASAAPETVAASADGPEPVTAPGRAEPDPASGPVPGVMAAHSVADAAADQPGVAPATDAVPVIPEDPAKLPRAAADATRAVDDAGSAAPDVAADPVQADPAAGTNGPEPPSSGTSARQPAPLSAPSGARGPEWIRAQESGHFTIQIIAGIDLEALQRFARRVSMESDVAWFRTRRGDEDWYAMVTGQYPDLRSAQSAAARLPAPVRRNQPWIRTFGSIQEAMGPLP